MWEDNRKKRLILNIILVLVIVAVVSGLVVAMLMVRQQTMEHDEQLSEIYVQQQQQQTEARQESVAAIQAEYEKDMQTVEDYLPGIVCWGDSLTYGASGNISYPAVLKTYLDTYFCDIYDFRSTIENADEYARLKWDDYRVSVPVINMGAGPEDGSTILGRAGALPYVLREDLYIPAGTEPVEIKLQSEDGKPVYPLTGGDVGVNNVLIGDTEGTITIDASNRYYGGDYQYYFSRAAEGVETMAPAGTTVKTAATDLYRDYIHIVWIGTYDSFVGSENPVEMVKTLLARQTKNSERYIVLGLCSVNKSVNNTYRMDSIDTAMMQAFGNRYINVRKYLVEDGLRDAGISPTSEDKINVAAGRIPKSFLSTSNGIELNGKAYALIGKLVYNRMESLGYFDEVFNELGIKDTTMQILKDDPTYFDRIIKNAFK